MSKAIFIKLVLLLFIAMQGCMNSSFAGNYKLSIATPQEFEAIRGEPLNHLYANIISVKLCYHLGQKRLYFINSKKFRFHIDFSNAVFMRDDDIGDFNTKNYSNTSEREYGLATLNYYKDQNIYTMEFVSEDDVPPSIVKAMYQNIADSFYAGNKVKVLLNNNSLLGNANQFTELPTILPEQIYSSQVFQPLVLGKTNGNAKVIKDLKAEWNTIQATDIIFIKGTPLQLPHCKAVVTNELQTPLSHINVLCNNRGIPACVIKNWDSIFRNSYLQGTAIELAVEKNGYQIKSVPQSAVLTHKLKSYKANPIDLVSTKVQPCSFRKKINSKTYGSKASGLNELHIIQQRMPALFTVPNNAFAIPFYYYRQHIIRNPQIQKEIDKLKKIAWVKHDSIYLQLKNVRAAFKKAKLDPMLLQLVKKQIRLSDTTKSYRFRSSSSAEDNNGFNGAGLYESYSGSMIDTNKDIEKAIKKVWASVWSNTAYDEREMFGIPHQTVAMGILCHEGFPAEDANGVAVTKNLFREDFPGFTINVQRNEVSVVAPPDSVTCDQLLIMDSESFTGEKGDVYEQYIARSNINNGKNVLTHPQVVQLYRALDAIKNYYYFKSSAIYSKMQIDDFGLDIEFKFNKGKLVIKQVRSYK
jgi:pyruvate, water dikinase